MTEQQLQEAYRRIEDGDSLTQIAKDYKVAKSHLYYKLTETSTLKEQYTRARELQAQTYVDYVISMSKDLMSGLSSEMVPSQRAAIDAFKWIACKFYPKMYGERQTLEHEGKDGGPIQVFSAIARNPDDPITIQSTRAPAKDS